MNKFNKVVVIVFSIITIVLSLFYKDFKILLFLLYMSVPFVIKLKDSYTSLYLIFGFLSVLLGGLLHFYKIFNYYDSITHTIWGFICGILAIGVLKIFKLYDSKNLLFNVLFVIIFGLATSCFWEVVEYITDTLFKTDLQRRLTGVHNTMSDIIVALIGNILFTMWYYHESKYNHKLLITKFIDTL